MRDQDIANAMVSVFQAVASNQVLVDRVGLDIVVDLFNQILRYAGVPDDYRLNIARATESTTTGKPESRESRESRPVKVENLRPQPVVTPADMQAAMHGRSATLSRSRRDRSRTTPAVPSRSSARK